MNLASSLKRQVIVHVTFIKIGEINTPKEVFDANVLVRSTWREPLLDNKTAPEDLSDFWNPKIFIENAVGEPQTTSSLHVTYDENGEASLVENKRFKGTYMEQMELWEFPFDTQELTVVVMSDRPSIEVDLTEDPDESHKVFKRSFIDEQEFYLYKYVTSEQKELQKDRADPFVMRSALSVGCCASRRPGSFVWNHFSVTFLIACLSFLTFAVPCTAIHNRLQLAFTLVLTTVAFKFVIGQSLPKISYLTYMDRYVISTMTVLTMVCVYHGVQSILPLEDYPHKDPIAMGIIGGIYVIYNVIFFVRLVLVPFREKRRLKKAETEYSKLVKEQALKKHRTQLSVPPAAKKL